MKSTRQEFVDLMLESRKVTWLVASKLLSLGEHVRLVPNIIAPDEKSRWDYVDDGDIEISHRIEIKHWPNIDFKSVDDIPYQEIIIDEAYKIEKVHRLKLYAYIIVNSSMTGGIIISALTKKNWRKVTKFDTREKRQMDCYVIDKKNVLYMDLVNKEK